MLTARLSPYVCVVVRLTTSLPTLVHRIVCAVKWYGHMDWVTASEHLETFELEVKAEDNHTLEAERLLAAFPCVNAVMARYLVANVEALDKFFTEKRLSHSCINESQRTMITALVELDVNPERTVALRKRKLGLSVSKKDRKQTTLSWLT